MSVLPVVGSELPTVFYAAVVDTVCVVDGLGNTLDAVDEGVGRSCVRMDSAELWPSIHDVCSVMRFLVRPVAVLTSQFFLSFDVGGDVCFSPGVSGWVPLTCPVHLDSWYMLPRKRGKVEKFGPHDEVWDWRSVLSDVARSSRLPELPDSDCCDRFRRIGRTCVLDLYCRKTDSCVQPLGGGIVSVDRSPFVPYCRV